MSGVGCSGTSQTALPPEKLPAACSVVGVLSDNGGGTGPTIDLSPVIPDTVRRVQADTDPKPKGGMRAVMKNVDVPKSALRQGVEGRAYVGFVVGTDGRAHNAKVLKEVQSESDAAYERAVQEFHRAAVQAVRQTRFAPGVRDGTPICTATSIPVTLRQRTPFRSSGGL
jgi:TonB family protein